MQGPDGILPAASRHTTTGVSDVSHPARQGQRTACARAVASGADDRSRGQSLVEFALVVPILLLVFAAAADLGRAFYAYIAIENGVKEGAFFGARSPLCDDPSVGGCARPRNVEWRVQNELNNLTNPDGSPLTPTVGVPRPDVGRRARGP